MGCEILTSTLADQYRDQFPVTNELIYLNHAAVAPLCRRSADAMKHLADDVCNFGSYHYDQWVDVYEGARGAAARLLNADAREIAFVKNTSEGIATVALGVDWRAGDKVVGFQEEFPANWYPWKRLEAKGVRVEWLSAADPLDRIDQAARGARLLTISHVQFLSGLRVDLEAIGEICARHDCMFFVDAIQGMGAFPIDVRKARIHALAADGHKWLLGPEGCGILFVQRNLQDAIEPVEFGYTNVANFADYVNRDMTLRSDAARYECGTLNTIGIFGLRASMEFLLEVGVERIAPVVQGLAAQIAQGAARKGYEVLGRGHPDYGSGIVSFRKEGVDARQLFADLKRQRIVAAPRGGWLRASPHFYIRPAEIDGLIELLP